MCTTGVLRFESRAADSAHETAPVVRFVVPLDAFVCEKRLCFAVCAALQVTHSVLGAVVQIVVYHKVAPVEHSVAHFALETADVEVTTAVVDVSSQNVSAALTTRSVLHDAFAAVADGLIVDCAELVSIQRFAALEASQTRCVNFSEWTAVCRELHCVALVLDEEVADGATLEALRTARALRAVELVFDLYTLGGSEFLFALCALEAVRVEVVAAREEETAPARVVADLARVDERNFDVVC